MHNAANQAASWDNPPLDGFQLSRLAQAIDGFSGEQLTWASGYLAGRAIWWPAFQHYPDLDAMRDELARDGVSYMQDIGLLTDQRAVPWYAHSCYGPGGADFADRGTGFRHAYPDFEGAAS